MPAKMLTNDDTGRVSSTKVTGFSLFLVYIGIALWATWLILTADPVLTKEGTALVENGVVVRHWSWQNVSGLLTGLATLPGFGTVMFGIKASQNVAEKRNGTK
jgi:hypothetical protein